MTQYGPEIPVNGKRPEWLGSYRGTLGYEREGCGWFGPSEIWTENDILSVEEEWQGVINLRLPAGHPYYTTQINYDLPVQTRDGRAVRILCTDAPGDYPVVGICDYDVMTWESGGTFFNNRTSGNNLMNVPAKPVRVSRWMGVGVGVAKGWWKPEEDPYIVSHWPQRLELIFEDGKLVEAVVHD